MQSFFFYSHNAPDAKVILNRGTKYEVDISDDVVSFNCGNELGNILGNFTVNINNTNDKHVDRYGYCDIESMSSIEIFVKTNIALTDQAPKDNDYATIYIPEEDSVQDTIYNYYGLNNFNKNQDNVNNVMTYLKQIKILNKGTTLNFLDRSSIVISVESSESFADRPLAAGTKLKFPPLIVEYKRIFMGVVLDVTHNFNAGTEMSIMLTGESVGYWLRASRVNIHPGAGEQFRTTASAPTAFANKYAETKALDIFKDLIKMSTNDTLTVSDFNISSASTNYEQIDSNNVKNVKVVDELGEPYQDENGKSITLSDAFAKANYYDTTSKDALSGLPSPQPIVLKDQTIASVLEACEKLKDSIQKGTRLDGTSMVELSNYASEEQNSVELDSSSLPVLPNELSVTQQTINSGPISEDYLEADNNYKNIKKQIEQSDSEQFEILSKSKPDSKEYQDAKNIIDENTKKLNIAKQEANIAKSLTENSGVIKNEIEIVDSIVRQLQQKLIDASNPTNAYDPANTRKVLGQLNIIEHWRQIFSNIVLEVANAAYLSSVYPLKTILKAPDRFEGDYQPKSTIASSIAEALKFEFHMDTNGHFVLKPPLYNMAIPKDDLTYIIEQEDITQMNIQNSVNGIITRIGVTGDIPPAANLVKEQTYNVHTDFNLLNKYGFHHTDVQNMIFINNVNDAKLFGESFMAKNNQELNSASVTVMGRPDIRLGLACYLKPRDTVYYIKGINHDFQTGQGYTTTINMIGARRIVTGFKALSPIRTISKKKINGILIRSSSEEDSGKISHYIQSHSSKSRDIELDANGSIAETSNIFILKNKFIITNHPNIGYIGLIVDADSDILKQININAFTYLYVACTPSVAINGVETQSLISEYLQTAIKDNKRTEPIKIIHDYLIQFIKDNNLGGMGGTDFKTIEKELKEGGQKLNEVAQDFTQDIFNKYISQFTQSLILSSSDNTKANSAQQDISAAGSYFGLILNDSGLFGSYKPYTDDDGREYPVTINFGIGLQLNDGTIQAQRISVSQQNASENAKLLADGDKIIADANTYYQKSNKH